MKVIAILNVDENLLAETEHNFKDEMLWVSPSGITLEKYNEIDKCSNYEYAAFVWNKKSQQYEQVGRAVITKTLCRNRFKEYLKKGCINKCYDINKVVFKKRMITVIYTDWEN